MNPPYVAKEVINAYKKMLENIPGPGLAQVKEILNTLFYKSSTADALTKAVLSLQSLVDSKEKDKDNNNDKETLEATFLLGFCYHLGVGVDQNDHHALYHFQRAAEQGHAFAQFFLGVSYREGYGIAKLDQFAVKYLTLAADQGLAFAQSDLGTAYLLGEGVTQDEKKAVELFTHAISQGFWGSLTNLGDCYREGTGVTKDENRAIEYYQFAAIQGDSTGQMKLAFAYYDGSIIAKDEKRAVELYTLAAGDLNPESLYALGSFYWKGNGVSENLERAVLLYQEAARQGDQDAEEFLKEVYENDPPYPDLNIAVAHYNSHKEVDPTALMTLAFCYQLGLGVSQNLDTAIDLYLQALKKNIPCHWDLYMCYRLLHQQGKSEPLAEFYETLDSARRNGNIKANLFFAYLHEHTAPGLPDHCLYTAHGCYEAVSKRVSEKSEELVEMIRKMKEKNESLKGIDLNEEVKKIFEDNTIEFDIDPGVTVDSYFKNKSKRFESLLELEEASMEFTPVRGVARLIAGYAFEPKKSLK